MSNLAQDYLLTMARTKGTPHEDTTTVVHLIDTHRQIVYAIMCLADAVHGVADLIRDKPNIDFESMRTDLGAIVSSINAVAERIDDKNA